METEIVNMRIKNAFDKKQLQIFAELQNKEFHSRVEFGRQDTRGGFSICWYGVDEYKHCIVRQQFFMNRWEMLGFVKGFNRALE